MDGNNIVMKNIEEYEHHGKNVFVQGHLKGKHRQHCLCMSCSKLHLNRTDGKNCPIAQAVFDNCKKYHITTPMWECPEYTPKGRDSKMVLDPVHTGAEGWYYWDETWAERHGPFESEHEARMSLAEYAKFLEENVL